MEGVFCTKRVRDLQFHRGRFEHSLLKISFRNPYIIPVKP